MLKGSAQIFVAILGHEKSTNPWGLVFETTKGSRSPRHISLETRPSPQKQDEVLKSWRRSDQETKCRMVDKVLVVARCITLVTRTLLVAPGITTSFQPLLLEMIDPSIFPVS